MIRVVFYILPILYSCTTTPESVTTGDAAHPCDPARLECSSETSFSVCSSIEGPSIQAYGRNLCQARSELAFQLCLQNRKLGESRCMPDPTGGECLAEQECAEKETSALVCFAGSYNGVDFEHGVSLFGVGKGKCRARVSLNSAACRDRLKPSLLGDLECRPLGEQCASLEDECDDSYFPHLCTLGENTSFGLNQCKAKKTLLRELCFTFKSNVEGEIVCRPSS